MTPCNIKCRIAELDVLISIMFTESKLLSRFDSYLSDFSGDSDFTIAFPNEFFQKRIEENPRISLTEAEYIWTGYEFCRKLLDHDGFVLHAPAVAYTGKAYLFSASSGTGKSTHAAIWEKVFGKDAIIINDDKPALRIKNDTIYVYGTPWSGKTDKNSNISVPLGGICFISKSLQIKSIECSNFLGVVNSCVKNIFSPLPK